MCWWVTTSGVTWSIARRWMEGARAGRRLRRNRRDVAVAVAREQVPGRVQFVGAPEAPRVRARAADAPVAVVVDRAVRHRSVTAEERNPVGGTEGDLAG